MLLESARLRIRDRTPAHPPAALDILSRVEVVKWLGEPSRTFCRRIGMDWSRDHGLTLR